VKGGAGGCNLPGAKPVWVVALDEAAAGVVKDVIDEALQLALVG
jgi:hypothetical protein